MAGQRPAPARQRREAFPERCVQPVTIDGGIAPSTPGSRAGLLPPSPLRTARESFPSSSSSLANAPCGTRSCHESGTTFTICAWSLRAVIRLESAPVSVITAVICFLSSGGWPNSLVMQDQTDVSSLSRGVMSPEAQPLSIPLQDGLRFFHPPMPARLSACLAACFPSRETYGVPMFRLSHNEWGRRALSTGSVRVHDKERGNPCTRYSALLAQA